MRYTQKVEKLCKELGIKDGRGKEVTISPVLLKHECSKYGIDPERFKKICGETLKIEKY